MYPYVELKIKDGVPSLVYYASEGVERPMTLTQDSIFDAAMFGGKELGLVDKNAEHNQENLEALLTLARESDETYYPELPDMELENIEFNLLKTLKPYLKKMVELTPDDYSDLSMTDDVKAELEKFQKADLFASYMEALYTILIAKTLLAANDLGIGNITLNDDFKNPRLMEKMSKELDKLEIELIIPEVK